LKKVWIISGNIFVKSLVPATFVLGYLYFKLEFLDLMLTIVLIDDDPISTFVTEKLISKNVSEPCKFFKYQSAKQALKEIYSIRPNYLFLDLNMPEMNGWDFLDSFNSSQNQAQIYILSSSVDDRDITKARTYSIVKDYLSKPLIKKYIKSIFS
jgi:CheY-like chemotaxis protein